MRHWWLSSALIWWLGLGGAVAWGEVHTVSPGESITAAVAKAKPGDTVQVRRGTYLENVVITARGTTAAPITIEGEPGTVLDGRVRDLKLAWQPAPDVGPGVYRASSATNLLLLTADGKYVNPLNPAATSGAGSTNYREILKNGLPRTRQAFNNQGLLFLRAVWICRALPPGGYEVLIHFHGDLDPNQMAFAGVANLDPRPGRFVGKAVVQLRGAANVVVRGFTIQHGWYAILLEGEAGAKPGQFSNYCENVRVEYNTVMGTQRGIYLDGDGVRQCRLYKNDISLPAWHRWNLNAAYAATYPTQLSALDNKAAEDLFELHKSLGLSDAFSLFASQTGPRVDVGYNYVHNCWQGPQDQARDQPGTCHEICFHHNTCDDFTDGGFEIGGDGTQCHVFNNTITNAGWAIRWKWPKGTGPLFIHHNLMAGQSGEDFVLFRRSTTLTYFYHNTCIGGNVAVNANAEWGGPNVFYRNNVFLTRAGRYQNPKAGNPPMAPDHVDYNVYNGDYDQSHQRLGYEAHGVLDPALKVNADGTLPAGSKAIDAGVDLSAHFGAPLPGCPPGYFSDAAPDAGARETEQPPPAFGVDPKQCGALAERTPVEPLFQMTNEVLQAGLQFAPPGR